MQIWAESGKSALPICNYSQILYQFLTFTQNLKRSPRGGHRDCSLDPQHPITDADVRLYVLLPIFPVFQLFAQGCHEYAQRSNIIFPTAAPNLLRNVGVCQNLTNIFGEQAQQFVFDGR